MKDFHEDFMKDFRGENVKGRGFAPPLFALPEVFLTVGDGEPLNRHDVVEEPSFSAEKRFAAVFLIPCVGFIRPPRAVRPALGIPLHHVVTPREPTARLGEFPRVAWDDHMEDKLPRILEPLELDPARDVLEAHGLSFLSPLR